MPNSIPVRVILITPLLLALPGLAQLGPLNWTEPVKVEANNIFLLWHDNPQVGNQSHQKTYDVDFLNELLPIDERIRSTPTHVSTPSGNAPFTDVATGKFTDGPRDNAVAVWGPGPTGIRIMLPVFDTTANAWTDEVNVDLAGDIQSDRIKVRTLDVDGDGLDEFIVSYLDNADSVRFSLYDVDSLLQPTLMASFCDRKTVPNMSYRARYSIATGDFNGDSTEELMLLVLEDYSGNHVTTGVHVYDFNGSDPVPSASGSVNLTVGYNLEEFDLIAAPGDYIAGGGQEIALAFSSSADGASRRVQMQMITVAPDLQSISMGVYFTRDPTQGTLYLGAASGDLYGDARDEIAVVVGKTAYLLTMITDDSLTIRPPQTLGSSNDGFGDGFTRAFHDFVKISDVDQDGKRDLVVVYDDMSDGNLAGYHVMVHRIDSVTGFTLSGQLFFDEDQPTPGTDPPQHEFRPFSITTGNFDGLNFTIGEPTHTVAQGVVQPVVLLNAPPVHFDQFDAVNYDLNECYNGAECDFGATYHKETTTSVEVTTTVHSDWVISAGMSLSGYASAEVAPLGIGAVVAANYENHLLVTSGEDFSNTNSASTTLTIGVEVTAKEDDRIYSTITEYDVWEYPIHHGNEDFARSTILTFVPLNVAATWFPSKSYNAVNVVPDHEVGNVLSYPAFAQLEQNPNMGQAIAADYNNDSFVLDASSDYEWFLLMQDFESTSADTTVESGQDIGVGYGIWRFDGDFSDSQLRTHTVSVSNAIELNVHLGSVDMSFGDAKYTVTPYAYWDTHGALVVDYAAKPEIAPPGFPATWWQQKYGAQPDPTFVLPWKYDPEKGFAISEPAKRKQTKDISFEPLVPLPDDTVTITARVRNFSLLATTAPVTVSFYIGDPEDGGIPLIGLSGTNTVSTAGPVPAQGRMDVQLRWPLPAGLGTFPRIYAVLDEGGLIDEIHEGNNTGFNVLNHGAGGVGIEDEELITPGFALGACFPNPFDQSTTIRYTIPEASRTTITVLDHLGRAVATVVDAMQASGTYTATFDAHDLAAGLYFYNIRSGPHTDTRKMMVVR